MPVTRIGVARSPHIGFRLVTRVRCFGLWRAKSNESPAAPRATKPIVPLWSSVVTGIIFIWIIGFCHFPIIAIYVFRWDKPTGASCPFMYLQGKEPSTFFAFCSSNAFRAIAPNQFIAHGGFVAWKRIVRIGSVRGQFFTPFRM